MPQNASHTAQQNKSRATHAHGWNIVMNVHITFFHIFVACGFSTALSNVQQIDYLLLEVQNYDMLFCSPLMKRVVIWVRLDFMSAQTCLAFYIILPPSSTSHFCPQAYRSMDHTFPMLNQLTHFISEGHFRVFKIAKRLWTWMISLG